jgi:subtilisin-like proprotein convertase family protein
MMTLMRLPQRRITGRFFLNVGGHSLVMKKYFLLFPLGLLIAADSRAVIYNAPVGQTIPDNDLNGIQNSQTFSGLGLGITDVNVQLNIAGGFNGDYYAFVTHSNVTAILLNRVGRSLSSSSGYGNGGFGPDSLGNPFTLDDQAANDVHFYQSVSYTLQAGHLTGVWQPDERNIDPLSSGALFSAAPRTAGLSAFNGMDPNGTWTFFIADVAAGSEGSLTSWSLDIATVPEPASGILLLSGVAGVGLARRKHG